MRTPGVYIVENNPFPNSVVEVATAVPAFIGYTEKAGSGGESLKNVPRRISSMAEYVHHFGGAPKARFTLSTVAPGRPDKATDAPGQHSAFTLRQVQYHLTRAPGQAGGRYLMHAAMKHFFQNGGGPCYVVSVGQFDDPDGIAAGDESRGLIGGLTPLLKAQEPTLVLVPDAVLLDEPACVMVQQHVLRHCGLTMRNRIAILDVWGGHLERDHPDYRCIDRFRSDIGTHQLDFAAAYYPWLHTSLVQADDLTHAMFFGDAATAPALVALLKADLGVELAQDHHKARAMEAALDDLALSDTQWLWRLQDDVAAGPLDDAAADPSRLSAFLEPHKRRLRNSVAGFSELFRSMLEGARAQMNLMPPSSAMAGLYTMVDNTRGVWKAPANISVAGVLRPAVEISHADQEDLNVTAQGKSINAIRSFVGEGTLVWGARTLDGNSLDWRYINVRRTMIMLEESCRMAAKALVFEPNADATWLTLRSMISHFLTGIWKRGGLAGAVPDDAFSVHVGLGETMTPEDVLEGILRVTVLVAISRPAEFIEITLQQQMQTS